jgi:hypothetical protein
MISETDLSHGLEADLVIWAANRFMHELPEGVEIVNLVHDEVDAIVTRETHKATVDLITGHRVDWKEAVAQNIWRSLGVPRG